MPRFLLVALCCLPAAALEGFMGDEPTSRLTDYLGDSISQEFDLEFHIGDVLSASLFDLTLRDESSFVVSLNYKYYLDNASLRTPEGYRREPSFSITAGFGNWGFTFIVPVEYDLYRGGGDVSLALGERVLLETGGTFTRIKGFGLLEDTIIGRTGLSYYPLDNLSLRVGWRFNRYENPAGAGGNQSGVTAGLGYLWGNAQRGVDASFSYRKRGQNGNDMDSNYYRIGANWYTNARLTICTAFEYRNGDAGFPTNDEAGHTVDVLFFLRPKKEFRVGGGYRNCYSRSAGNDYSSYLVSMSYAF